MITGILPCNFRSPQLKRNRQDIRRRIKTCLEARECRPGRTGNYTAVFGREHRTMTRAGEITTCGRRWNHIAALMRTYGRKRHKTGRGGADNQHRPTTVILPESLRYHRTDALESCLLRYIQCGLLSCACDGRAFTRRQQRRKCACAQGKNRCFSKKISARSITGFFGKYFLRERRHNSILTKSGETFVACTHVVR